MMKRPRRAFHHSHPFCLSTTPPRSTHASCINRSHFLSRVGNYRSHTCPPCTFTTERVFLFFFFFFLSPVWKESSSCRKTAEPGLEEHQVAKTLVRMMLRQFRERTDIGMFFDVRIFRGSVSNRVTESEREPLRAVKLRTNGYAYNYTMRGVCAFFANTPAGDGYACSQYYSFCGNSSKSRKN